MHPFGVLNHVASMLLPQNLHRSIEPSRIILQGGGTGTAGTGFSILAISRYRVSI